MLGAAQRFCDSSNSAQTAQMSNYMTRTNVTIPLKVSISDENLNFTHVSVGKNGPFAARFSEKSNGQLTTWHPALLHAMKMCIKWQPGQ